MTTIGASLIINGQVTSREDITIHGRVKGEISMEAGA
jgi:cytoskeletal protein CcmA (bactofilin family)